MNTGCMYIMYTYIIYIIYILPNILFCKVFTYRNKTKGCGNLGLFINTITYTYFLACNYHISHFHDKLMRRSYQNINKLKFRPFKKH